MCPPLLWMEKVNFTSVLIVGEFVYLNALVAYGRFRGRGRGDVRRWLGDINAMLAPVQLRTLRASDRRGEAIPWLQSLATLSRAQPYSSFYANAILPGQTCKFVEKKCATHHDVGQLLLAQAGSDLSNKIILKSSAAERTLG
jgi:hypothetical protein